MVQIRAFAEADTEAVVALWQEARLVRPWNDPYRDIQRKTTTQPGMFLVAADAGSVVGTAMVGYDGHRGWIHYFVDGQTVYLEQVHTNHPNETK